MAVCPSCGEEKIIIDPDSGQPVCSSSSCGCVVSTSEFCHQAFTSDGQPTGFLQQSVGDFGHRERKLYHARNLITDLTARLGLSTARAAEAAALASDVTDGTLGEGEWFPVLVAACSYIVARRHSLPLSLSEAAAAVGHDACDLGRMATRVARHFRFSQLPDFDLAGALERAVRVSCPGLAGLEPEKANELIGQGRFLLHCATKWFLTTGRQPLPMVAAVLAFVAESNGVRATVEEISKDINAGIKTSKLRLKELMETLIRVARSLLPWGKDVTINNLVQNAPLLIRLMERKSNSDSREGLGFGFGGAFLDGQGEDSNYFKINGKANCDDVADDAKLSVGCISSAYDKVLRRIDHLKQIGEFDKLHMKKLSDEQMGIDLFQDAWEGRWAAEKNLTFEQVLERDVGYDALPPSFVAGIQARRLRRTKIEAANQRIKKIMMLPSNVDTVGKAEEDDLILEEMVGRKRKRKRQQEDLLDWEDCIIELLLLHRVKAAEIEQGQYSRLLDLHVFNL